MKYMLLVIRSDPAWEALTDDQRDYESIIGAFLGADADAVPLVVALSEPAEAPGS